MQLLDITIKDLRQASRTLTLYFFMFGVPILVSLLFLLLFGGLAGEEDGAFDLPRTAVVVANLDQGQLPAGFGDSLPDLPSAEAGSMGDLLLGILRGEGFADLMDISEVADAAAARATVDNQEAGVALIIPANFTAAMLEEETTADIALFQDPTLNFGPTIIESIVRQLVDLFAAGKIGVGVTVEGLAASGVPISPELVGEIVARLSPGPTGSPEGAPLIADQSPPGSEEGPDLLTEIISVILGGMMIFFAFFTASASIQTILVEEEKGTLARLFTTPITPGALMGGKALAAVIMVSVQIAVLMLFGRFVFGIHWGDPLPVLLAAAGIVLITPSAGIFLVSLLKDTRQGGVVFGGLLTITGMLGMIPAFTSGVPNQPPAVETASLLVPQGWANRGLTMALEGGNVADILPTLGVLLIWSIVLVAIGLRRFQRRFA